MVMLLLIISREAVNFQLEFSVRNKTQRARGSYNTAATTALPSECVEQNMFPLPLEEAPHLYRGLQREVTYEMKTEVRKKDSY